MRTKKLSPLLFLPFVISSYLLSDTKINGRVISTKSNKPIQNVNIYVKDQKRGTTSDASGNFELFLEEDSSYSIEFSHIAYENRLIKTVPGNLIDVKMKEVFLMLDDVIVSSMKCEYALSNVPVYSEVIGKSKIVEAGNVSIAEVLEQQLGISKKYDAHGMFDYNLMGLESKYILVMKNGKPINGKFQDMIDLDQILVSNVDKIEIIKGPGSSLHGSDAIGGVINIITAETPEDSKLSLKYRRTMFDIGTENSRNNSSGNIASFNISKKFGNFSWGTSGQLQDLLNQSSITPLNKDEIRKLNLNTELYWVSKSEKDQFGLMLDYFGQNDIGRDLLSTGYELSSNTTNISRMSTTLTHEWILSERLRFNQSLNKSDYEREYRQKGIDDSFTINNIATESLIDFDAKLQFSLNKNNILLGFNSNSPSYRSKRLIDSSHVMQKIGIYVQNEYSQNERLKIVYGLRAERYAEEESFNPRLALMYIPKNNYKARFSLGKGFRAPSVQETFINFHNVDQGYIVKGNSRLRPEKSIGSSFNIEYSNEKDIRLNGLLYYNYFSDKILTEQVGDPGSSPTVFTYNNISNATYQGVELFADFVHSNSLTLKFNLNLRDEIDSEGKKLKNTIPYSAGFELSYLIRAINTRLYLNQSQSYRYATDTSFGLMDIIFNTRLSELIKISVGIKNITNYVDKTYGPFKGRSVYLEISNN